MPLCLRRRQHKSCWRFFCEATTVLFNNPYLPSASPTLTPTLTSDHPSRTSTGVQFGKYHNWRLKKDTHIVSKSWALWKDSSAWGTVANVLGTDVIERVINVFLALDNESDIIVVRSRFVNCVPNMISKMLWGGVWFDLSPGSRHSAILVGGSHSVSYCLFKTLSFFVFVLLLFFISSAEEEGWCNNATIPG